MGGQPYFFNARNSDAWRDILAAALTCRNLISGILNAVLFLAVLMLMIMRTSDAVLTHSLMAFAAHDHC